MNKLKQTCFVPIALALFSCNEGNYDMGLIENQTTGQCSHRNITCNHRRGFTSSDKFLPQNGCARNSQLKL